MITPTQYKQGVYSEPCQTAKIETFCENSWRLKVVNSFMTEAVIIKKPSTDLLCKPMGWFLYDNGLCHERVDQKTIHVRCLAEF